MTLLARRFNLTKHEENIIARFGFCGKFGYYVIIWYEIPVGTSENRYNSY